MKRHKWRLQVLLIIPVHLVMRGLLKTGFKRGEINGEDNQKLAFGDFPEGSFVVNKGKHFDEIF